MDQLIQDLPAVATSIQIGWGILLAISIVALGWMSLKLLTSVIKVGLLAILVYSLTPPVPEMRQQIDGALSSSRATLTDWLAIDETMPSVANIAADQLLAREERPEPQGLELSK
ncbi:uncharacterized protein METZ01_LOCUS497304 [marine metagenome]|uniref:Uncharacterized protein n=1 Tax=marine metagenome TaxID=408172 RepID=A0A383DJF6_9ZZZZ